MSIDLFLYQKSPNFNTGVVFSKWDIYAYKSMKYKGIFEPMNIDI